MLNRFQNQPSMKPKVAGSKCVEAATAKSTKDANGTVTHWSITPSKPTLRTLVGGYLQMQVMQSSPS